MAGHRSFPFGVPAGNLLGMTSSAPRRFGRALLSFLAFPVGGGLAHLVVGPVDGVLSALLGGLVAGAAIGGAQAAASARRLSIGPWAAATACGLAVGLAAGAAVVGYRTSLGALAGMGALSGVAVGVAQAWTLRAGAARRVAWSLLQPGLWALGWTVTSLAGVDVEQRYVVFGAIGALMVAAGFALALERLASRPGRPGDGATDGSPAGVIAVLAA